MQLASRFASSSPVLRSDCPLSDEQICTVAPSIFADAPHESRSQRYAYIPTATILTALRNEGFQPFMVTQPRIRDESKREHTKHMVRLRHAHSIINRPPKPAWIKGMAVIDMCLLSSLLPSETQIFCWRGRWSDLRGDDSFGTIINQTSAYKRVEGATNGSAYLVQGISTQPVQRFRQMVRLPLHCRRWGR